MLIEWQWLVIMAPLGIWIDGKTGINSCKHFLRNVKTLNAPWAIAGDAPTARRVFAMRSMDTTNLLYIEQVGIETSNVAELASILLQCIVSIRLGQTLAPIPGTLLLLAVDYRTDEKTKKITKFAVSLANPEVVDSN